MTNLPNTDHYDDWLKRNYPRTGPTYNRSIITGAKLRRIASMRRSGEPLKVVSSAIGLAFSSVALWHRRLPKDMK